MLELIVAVPVLAMDFFLHPVLELDEFFPVEEP